MVGLGSGELNPMAIAAIGAAISIFFIFGACVISVHGNVAWSFAVFLLAFLQGACATALAFYESASQRTRAITDLHSIRTTTAQIVESAPRPIDGG